VKFRLIEISYCHVYGKIVLLQEKDYENMKIPKNGKFILRRLIFYIFNLLVLFKVRFPPKMKLSIDCGGKFATNEMLKEHYSDFHSSTGNSPRRGIGEKRKLVDDDITPMIEVMPLETAR
jgi:hypothetical protein